MNDLSLPPIRYYGSVKNIRQDLEEDYLFFEFSDRYSIYDWGEMPDTIAGKGKNLCCFTDFLYQQLEKPNFWQEWKYEKYKLSQELINHLTSEGMLTHRYQNENAIKNLWKVKSIYIPKIIDKDYSFYQKKPLNTLVPLEVVFRFGVPKGSSLLKRLEDTKYLKQVGLNTIAKEGQWLESPIIEFSTKLEARDQYLTYEKAKEIAGMGTEEFYYLIELSKIIAYRLKDFMKERNLDLWDGKFEFSFDKGVQSRRFRLVDTIAPDEIRLMYKDMPLSKEVLRQAYWNSQWYLKIEDFKKRFGDEWQKEMKKADLSPHPIKKEQLDWVKTMYKNLCHAVSGRGLSKDKVDKMYKEYQRLFT